MAAKKRIVDQLPSAELAVVTDVRHALPVEKPKALHQMVDEFLARLEEESINRSGQGQPPEGGGQ